MWMVGYVVMFDCVQCYMLLCCAWLSEQERRKRVDRMKVKMYRKVYKKYKEKSI